MEPIPLPVIPVADAENTGLVFLPHVAIDHLETVSFKVQDDVLRVRCYYSEEHDEDERLFPIKITESNRDLIESMTKIVIMNPEEVDPEKLTSHPKERDKLNRLRAQIKSTPDSSPLNSSNGFRGG